MGLEVAALFLGTIFGIVLTVIYAILSLVISIFVIIYSQFIDLFDWLIHPYRWTAWGQRKHYLENEMPRRPRVTTPSPRDSTYYDVLGIDEDAPPEEIKKSFRDLVKNYHPDVNPAKNAAAMFRMIKSSYDVLSDPKRRQLYNATLKTAYPDPDDWDNIDEDAMREYMQEKIRHGIGYSVTFSISTIFYNWGMLLESAVIGLFAGMAANMYLGLATNPCIIIGIITGVLMQFLFYIKIGVWVVSIGCAVFWAWLGFEIAQSNTQSNVWIWSVTIPVFLFSLAFHIKTKTEVC